MERPLRLTLLVYEPVESVRVAIRAAVTAFAARRDVDLRIDWVLRTDQEAQIPRVISDTLVALVSAGMGEHSAIAGRLIYDANPDCFLIYYGKAGIDLSPLLAARPVAYNPDPDSEEAWEKALGEILERIQTTDGYFRWSGKDHRYYLPHRSITHIRSERVYLDVFTVSGTTLRMVGKLDEAAKQLPFPTFLRIHQSELVNMGYARALDRSRRCLIMDDGSELYISRAHYREAVEQFGKK